VLVDTQGFVLEACIQPGSVQDRDGAKDVLEPLRSKYPRLSKIWADGNSECVKHFETTRAGV